MTLTLRILNYDALDTGGPLWITVAQAGCSVGRRSSMDWVLPDPGRHISGHHFDITFADGRYWLTDVSKNGTFLQGSRYRLDGPHALQPTDQLLVGHYIIGVEMEGAGAAPVPPFGTPGFAPAAPHDEADPWDLGPSAPYQAPAPAPVPRPSLQDMPQDFIPLNQPAPPPAPMPETPAPQAPPAPAPPAAPMPPSFTDGPPPSVAPVDLPPAGAPPAMPPPEIAPFEPPVPPAASAVPSAAPQASDSDILRAFCEGAGLDPVMIQDVNATDLARMLGAVVRTSSDEMMTMLQDRASVKHFTRGGERTMRSATGNNPLKFMPDSTAALEAMFIAPKAGFMNGQDGFRNALTDLRRHQGAVFAALQPALAHVLKDLSPEEIEADVEGGLLGSSKRGKAWDTFVARWDEKADKGDNGMLDAFLEAFAEAYAKASSQGTEP